MMKVLIIDFYYGTDNVGGLRWKKFAKYLPSEGIESIILTSGNEVYNKGNVYYKSYPFKFNSSHGFAYGRDDSWWGKVKRFLRGNLFIPDPRRLWCAYSTALELVVLYGIDVVITTGPPHSVHLIGLRLKRERGLKWIADFRDPWIPYWYKDVYLSNFASNTQYRIYHKVLSNADKVLQVEERLIASGATVLSNGFDPEDFEIAVPKAGTDFVYVGSLTDRKLLPPINFKHIKNVSHDEAIKEMCKAGYLLVAYPDDVIPSKVYEYLASGRPILSFGIRGKGAELIERCGAGIHTKNLQLYSWLLDLPKRNESEIQKYNVKNLTKQLAQIINDLQGG
jgi:hypothetical protein